MSSCLLPPFKCQLDSFSIQFRTSHYFLRQDKGSILFQPQCVISTATSVVDVKKPRLSSFSSHSDSLLSDKQWSYTAVIGTPTTEKYSEALATESLLTNDEAVVAAAAAETLALARAAIHGSRHAVLICNNHNKKSSILSVVDKPSMWANQLTERERAGILGHLVVSKSDHETESLNKEVELLEEQISISDAVRSTRQIERKARRAIAVEKQMSGACSLKIGSSIRRKRISSQEIDLTDPLRHLRGATSTSKLLTAREERELSEGIQEQLKMERLRKELADRCGKQPTFDQWASAAGINKKTLRQRIDHGTHCKEKMVKSNIRLVFSIAKNYQGVGMNLQDLVQEGCKGLMRGAEKFDATKGFKFSTYAHWWIKQAVRKSLSDQSRTIRLPFHMVEATYRVKEARKRLYSENGRKPNDEEVAEATGLSMKRLTAVLLSPKAPRSLDQKIGFDQNLKPSDVIAHPEAETSEEILMKQFMRHDLKKVLDSLSTRESQVIRWRFGIEDGRMKTLQEIGEAIGISRERVRQIESSALRKLKNKKRSGHLHQYLVA